MDMDGRILHEWRARFADAAGLASVDGKDRQWWRRAWPYENGDVLALITGAGLMKLDGRSRVLWVRPMNVHHDLRITSEDLRRLTEKALAGLRMLDLSLHAAAAGRPPKKKKKGPQTKR